MFAVARVLLPAGALLFAVVAFIFSVGAGLVAGAVAIAPVGILAFIDDKKVGFFGVNGR